ncbi:MAG: hypothetical protein V4574_17640 [Pseudomonadota bacterium]
MFYSAGNSSGRHEQRVYDANERHSRDSIAQIRQVCSAKQPADQAQCVREFIGAEREAKHNESDLAAQWKAADWVMWAGVLAGVQLLISAIGLYALLETIKQGRRALKRARKANRISEDTAKRQLRAYLIYRRLVFTPVFNISSRSLTKVKITAMFENRGQTPAFLTSMFFHGEFFPIDEEPAKPTGEHQIFDAVVSSNQEVTVGGFSGLPLTVGILADIFQKKSRFFVNIVLKYRDIFGASWETHQVVETVCHFDPQVIVCPKRRARRD